MSAPLPDAPFACAAVVAAAGRGRRMGAAKQLLPWGAGTVLGTVAAKLAAAGAAPVLCVLAEATAPLRRVLEAAQAVAVCNPEGANGDMIGSYRAGVAWLAAAPEHGHLHGALLALGDQPHLPAAELAALLAQAARTPNQPTALSYAGRRGHPIYLPRRLWAELLALPPGDTLRTLLQLHARTIVYVSAASDAVLRDIDTPAEYAALAAQYAPRAE